MRQDFVFVSGQKGNLGMVPFVQRPLEKVAALPPATRRSKIRELQACGADDATIGRYVPNHQAPIRQYYRSKTNQPMLDGDWEIDSDDESDPWVHKINEAVSSCMPERSPATACLMLAYTTRYRLMLFHHSLLKSSTMYRRVKSVS